MARAFLLLLLLGCAFDGSRAQEAGRKSFTIPQLEKAPALDGVLDEDVWQRAAQVNDLTNFSPVPGVPASEDTQFFLYFDDDALYIGAKLQDRSVDKIVRRQLIQNQAVFDDDHVQIILDPYDTRRGGYLFYVNPNGVQRDGLVFGNNRFNMNWDGIWQAKSAVSDDGWSVEMAMPFKTLSFDPERQDWGINLVRAIRRTGEEAAWSYREARPSLDATGQMIGIQGIENGRGLDVVASAALTERRDFFGNESDTDLEPSLDVFYRLTPSLTAALTVNTDFSATEVDDRQVNLTRFSLFFPEKRDFFLQDADIFEFGELSENGRPFFSRTIGLSPGGVPVDLIGGMKLTGRAGPWSLGVLGVRQDEFSGLSESDLVVARAYRRVLEQSTVGGIVTYGDPASDRDNWLGGLDFQFRNTSWFDGRSVEGEVWFQQSHDPDVDGDDQAFGIALRYPNDRTYAVVGFNEIQENFDPAMGFVNRAGIRSYTAELSRRIRFSDRWLRYVEFGVSGEEIRGLDGLLESRVIEVEPLEFLSRQGDELEIYLTRETEQLREPFQLLGRIPIAVDRYDFYRYGLELETPGFRTFGVSFGYEGGEFFDGDRTDVNMTLNYRPSRHFKGALSYQINDVDLPSGRFIARLMALRTSVAFNVEWSWINFIQYDNISDRIGVNSRVRWIPKQGQEFFVVLNYDFLDDGTGRFDSGLRDTTLKFSYTFRY